MVVYPQHHSFHIPVMGLAFTIDSPVKVARFGIPSVISIVEDRLVEMMRKHYYEVLNEKFRPITNREPDFRARRIQDYLNLVNRIVNQQIEQLKQTAFRTGSEIVKYFEMLPEGSKLGQLYARMTQTENEAEKESLEIFLRSQIRPGSIDVNIMTKLDKNNYDETGAEIIDGSDAVAALRGYATSNLVNSSIILSAGMNPRLFNYLDKFTDFEAVGWGQFRKKVVIKVSDFRSATVQGKMLAKKGIWVSEFRIESGLNCGGHAFATDGYLLGPILQEFRDKRTELVNELQKIYNAATETKGKPVFSTPHPLRITVQGGIGTAEEDRFLKDFYQTESTGWGTPFLLCPEATTVDEGTLQLLSEADESKLSLSKNSPLGVRFHHLKGTTADQEKERRIQAGKPGSPCHEKFLVSNTEFTKDPICTASAKYQRLKLDQLKNAGLPEREYERKKEEVLAKECLCVGLSNSAALVYNHTFIRKADSVTICPGPNIAYFNRIVTLQEMTDHIYGRTDLLEGRERPHMFINELKLYINYLAEICEEGNQDAKHLQYCQKFTKNLLEGIAYYRNISDGIRRRDEFMRGLEKAETEIRKYAATTEPIAVA